MGAEQIEQVGQGSPGVPLGFPPNHVVAPPAVGFGRQARRRFLARQGSRAARSSSLVMKGLPMVLALSRGCEGARGARVTMSLVPSGVPTWSVLRLPSTT